MTRTVTMSPDPVRAGDTLTICVSGEPTGLADLELHNGSTLFPKNVHIEVNVPSCFQWPVPGDWDFVVTSLEHAADVSVIVIA